jgi:hypothetical protein
MVWYVNPLRRAARRLLLLWACLLLGRVEAARFVDPETDRWFARHGDDLWRPLAARWDEVKAAMTSPAKKLSIPLEYHVNGRAKALLRADQAQIFPDGMIFAEKVRVEMFSETGKPDGLLTAEGCLFDRTARHGYCQGRVRVEKGGDRLQGVGMYFSTERQCIKILGDCEIRTHRIRNNFGRLK